MSIWNTLVSRLPFEWAQFGFMQNALLAILLVSPVFAILGCSVITSQMAFFSEAIGHAALTGIAIGVILGLADPMWSMLGFGVLLAVTISAMRRRSAASTDTVIGLTMAFSVALGVMLLSRGGGFAKYSRFLVGDVLTVSPVEIRRLLWLLLAMLALWGFAFNRIFLVSVNRSLARSRGLPVWLIETLLAVVIAVVVTMTIPWIGLLVINSMLILPAAASRNVARNTPSYLLGAVAISLVSGVAGLLCSYYWSTATGATIVLLAMGCYVLTLFWRRA